SCSPPDRRHRQAAGRSKRRRSGAPPRKICVPAPAGRRRCAAGTPFVGGCAGPAVAPLAPVPPQSTSSAAVPEEVAVSRTLYRPFFLAGIAVVLTVGAAWGAWLLWQIGFAHRFTGVSLHHVNAHGHAQ